MKWIFFRIFRRFRMKFDGDYLDVPMGNFGTGVDALAFRSVGVAAIENFFQALPKISFRRSPHSLTGDTSRGGEYLEG